MKAIESLTAYALACISGMVLWFGASMASRRSEAWDSPLYWSVAYPLALVISALLGYFFPTWPWRWPLVLFLAQFVSMIIRNGELGSLWPLGMAFFCVLSVPAVLLALFAALMRSRIQKKS